MWAGYCFDGLKNKENDTKFYDIRQEPFTVHGLWNPAVNYRRLPDDVAANSGAVGSQSINCSGGRVRFSTDSPYVVIRVKHRPYNNGYPHVTRLANIGVDLYIDKKETEAYFASFYPPIDKEEEYEGIKYFPTAGMHEVTLYMPTGTEIYSFEVGLKSGSSLLRHRDYKISVPIVFYGSSITNGYAASRPGNMYEGFISRKLDCDFINLGFSGSAKGETATAEYIAGLNMSAFVMDYDWNASNAEQLAETHKPFFEIIRKANPNLPVIFLTRPDSDLKTDCMKRRDAVMKTYIDARESGDTNVFFIDGYSLFPDAVRNDCTVDGCHPNDLGFFFMAEKIGGVLKEILP